jgi:hypothetical protein
MLHLAALARAVQPSAQCGILELHSGRHVGSEKLRIIIRVI